MTQLAAARDPVSLRRLRGVVGMAVALMIPGVGCSGGSTDPEPARTVTFLGNDSAFSGFVGGGFSMNLVFRTPPGTVAPEITGVRFLPAAPWFEVTDVAVNENDPDGESRRWALGLTARGTGPGEQHFTDLELATGEVVTTVPIGIVRVKILDGASAGLFPLFASGGVHSEPIPFEFTVENTTDSTAVLKGLLVDHPLIRFEAPDIAIDGSPLPSGGYRLGPGAKVGVVVHWTIEPPAGPVNLEARPLLIVDREGEVRYTGLHNMVIRRDAAIND